jgi:hypothetical protein
MQNLDGTASCDRCGRQLEGYGVIHGMISSDLGSDGEIINRIFCYETCRDAIVTAATRYLAKKESE